MDIQKSTYVEADEETTKAMTFDLMNGLHEKIDKLIDCYEKHLGVCELRFKKIENRKKVDTVISGSAGLIGGFISSVTQWFK